MGPQSAHRVGDQPAVQRPAQARIQTVINADPGRRRHRVQRLAEQGNRPVHLLSPQDLAAARADPKLNPLMHFFNNFQSTYLALDTLQAPLDNLDFRTGAGACHRPRHPGAAGVQRHPRGRLLDAAAGLPGLQPRAEGASRCLTWKRPSRRPGRPPASTRPAVTLELYPNGRDEFMEFVKQQWETNLGITVNLNQLEAGVWGQNRADHAMQVYRGPYEYDFVDPSNMLTGLFRSHPGPRRQVRAVGLAAPPVEERRVRPAGHGRRRRNRRGAAHQDVPGGREDPGRRRAA